MLPRLQLDAEPPPSKTKHDIARLAKAREKRIAQVQKLAARRNCSLLEVVEGDKHMHDLQHTPDLGAAAWRPGALDRRDWRQVP